MNDATFAGVVMGYAVPFVCQLLAATVGGGSDRRTARTSLDDFDSTVKYRYVFTFLPAGKIRGLWGDCVKTLCEE